MTGGGVLATTPPVHHGFDLGCSADSVHGNLEVNWQGHRFHLTALRSVACSDDPAIGPGQPAAGFDTLSGEGSGLLDGAPATVSFRFTDAGGAAPDAAHITVLDADGHAVLDAFADVDGRQQAHAG
jgi:hypothetical protein